MLGLADNPGELSGYGPIPAAAARTLAADGEWRRLVTDPTTGALLDYGRRSSTPSAALREFLLARDGTCRFPGCPVPAVRCDLDHEVPFDAGGPTDRANLGALCRRHHRLKTLTGWQLQRHARRQRDLDQPGRSPVHGAATHGPTGRLTRPDGVRYRPSRQSLRPGPSPAGRARG